MVCAESVKRVWGSSPHVRGAPLDASDDLVCSGIIPACAGSTSVATRNQDCPRDHPRMCGEHQTGAVAITRRSGIIPACAGSTTCTGHLVGGLRDHPRMCGEHKFGGALFPSQTGSSPHVRGARIHALVFRLAFGIIPACAGSTVLGCRTATPPWDHPRMCGEHRRHTSSVRNCRGSSPHVRGARFTSASRGNICGIIPACAGSTRRVRACGGHVRDHPRMCGEHPPYDPTGCAAWGSSPHVRGAHFENSIIPRKRKDNWLFFIQFRFENFLAFRYLLALLHPFLGVPTKDPSFASLGRLINCNPSQSTGDQSAPYTLKAICCSFLAE